MFNWLYPKASLEEADVERGLRMLLFDGQFNQAMLVLTTGAFLIAYALQLGASNMVIGLLAAIGPLAQVLQIPSILIVERVRKRKLLVITVALWSRLAFVGIAVAPWVLPHQLALPAFLGLLLLHFGLGNIAGCAYNSWLRDFIPADRMSGFFAQRLTLATIAGATLCFMGGVAVDLYKEHVGDDVGIYSILFTIGAASGLLSLLFLSRTPEPVMPVEEVLPIRTLLTQPLRDRNFRNLLIFLAWWSFAVNFAAPFFAVYLLDYLDMSMTWVLGLSVLSQVFNVFFFGIWGRLSDRFSNKSVLVMSVPLFFFSFLIWPLTTLPDKYVMTIPLLIAIHVLSGISTAGVALCANNLALKSAPFGKAGAYLAVNALVSGIAATVAPILAGTAADFFEPHELRLTISYIAWQQNLEPAIELPAVDLRGMDFIFIAAFAFGMFSLHRLLAVKEEGEVREKVLRQAFIAETRRVVRQVSTVAGMRQVMAFPFGFLTATRRKAN